MWKLIKWLFYIFLFLFVLFIIGPLVTLYAAPNQFKPQLINLLQKATGKEVSINGNISWTLMPSLGMQLPDVKVGDLLSAKNITIDVNFTQLFKGQLQMNDMVFDTVTIHLIKDQNGQRNWVLKKTNKPAVSNSLSPNATHAKPNPNFIKYAAFTASNIYLKNSQIIYEDQQKQIRKVIDVDAKAQLVFNQNTIRLDNIDAKTNQYQWQGYLEQNIQRKDLSMLNGKLQVSGNNGVLDGIDLFYYKDLINKLINKSAGVRPDTGQTPFGSLTATLNIQNGIVNNNDLNITANEIHATGQGKIDLITQTIDYKILLQNVPILIAGNLNKPGITVDVKDYLIQNYSQTIKDKIRSLFS